MSDINWCISEATITCIFTRIWIRRWKLLQTLRLFNTVPNTSIAAHRRALRGSLRFFPLVIFNALSKEFAALVQSEDVSYFGHIVFDGYSFSDAKRFLCIWVNRIIPDYHFMKLIIRNILIFYLIAIAFYLETSIKWRYIKVQNCVIIHFIGRRFVRIRNYL